MAIAFVHFFSVYLSTLKLGSKTKGIIDLILMERTKMYNGRKINQNQNEGIALESFRFFCILKRL